MAMINSWVFLLNKKETFSIALPKSRHHRQKNVVLGLFNPYLSIDVFENYIFFPIIYVYISCVQFHNQLPVFLNKNFNNL